MHKLKETAFQVIQETPVAAPPKKVWKVILNAEKWFQFSDRKVKQTLEAWPGGRWIMHQPDGAEVLFGFVSLVEPEKLIRIWGPVGLSHLPSTTALIIELQPKKDGKETLLRLGMRTFGYLDKDVKKRYSGGWTQLMKQVKALAEK
jgi:uncharacterized protein YndB with AHSA1/START domain